MKIKYMMMVSIMLAIITIGAASAAENITDDVPVAVDATDDAVEITDESVREEDVLLADIDEENALSYEDNENVLSGDETGYDFRLILNTDGDDSIGIGDNIRFGIIVPDDITGSLTLTVNGKSHDLSYYQGNSYLDIPTTGWKLGSYSAVVKYSGDDRYAPDYRQVDFVLKPGIYIPSFAAIGEMDPVQINAQGLNGEAQIVITTSEGQEIKRQSFIISNGVGTYSISDLDQGFYFVQVSGQAGDYSISKTSPMYVIKNSPKITVSPAKTVITAGESAIINVAGPQDVQLYFMVDGETRKAVYLYYGPSVEHFSGLGVGTHKIKVFTPGGMYFYSNVFTITVKAKEPVKKDVIKLTLGKVKVKKSAKKLVIKATLKINGKAKKGLKVKFKFGKKSYTAKTSAKGVAKITVKKAVLKKLKVGKKLTYKATYGKTVKKVTVKVKK